MAADTFAVTCLVIVRCLLLIMPAAKNKNRIVGICDQSNIQKGLCDKKRLSFVFVIWNNNLIVLPISDHSKMVKLVECNSDQNPTGTSNSYLNKQNYCHYRCRYHHGLDLAQTCLKPMDINRKQSQRINSCFLPKPFPITQNLQFTHAWQHKGFRHCSWSLWAHPGYRGDVQSCIHPPSPVPAAPALCSIPVEGLKKRGQGGQRCEHVHRWKGY